MADKSVVGCWACGKLDHESQDCVFKRCFVCSEQGHESALCQMRRQQCRRCQKQGHRDEACPAVEYSVALSLESDLYFCRCVNCGEEGHLNCGAVPSVSSHYQQQHHQQQQHQQQHQQQQHHQQHQQQQHHQRAWPNAWPKQALLTAQGVAFQREMAPLRPGFQQPVPSWEGHSNGSGCGGFGNGHPSAFQPG
ncbi:unnamed protein product, partial [Polarella glacialis]